MYTQKLNCIMITDSARLKFILTSLSLLQLMFGRVLVIFAANPKICQTLTEELEPRGISNHNEITHTSWSWSFAARFNCQKYNIKLNSWGGLYPSDLIIFDTVLFWAPFFCPTVLKIVPATAQKGFKNYIAWKYSPRWSFQKQN